MLSKHLKATNNTNVTFGALKALLKPHARKSPFECSRFAHVHNQALARTSPLNPACGFKWPKESC